MRCAAYFGLLTISVTTVALAQATPPAGKQPPPPKMTFAEATTSTVTKLEDSWAAALVRRDKSTFERLLAPKFIYSEDSVTMDRQTVLRMLIGSDIATEAHNDSMVVNIFGNTAVVTGWL